MKYTINNEKGDYLVYNDLYERPIAWYSFWEVADEYSEKRAKEIVEKLNGDGIK